MRDEDAVRKLLQWETRRMKLQFRADMKWAAKRIIFFSVLFLAATWLDHYLTMRFLK